MNAQLYKHLIENWTVRVNNNTEEVIKLPTHGELIESLLESNESDAFKIIVEFQRLVDTELELGQFIPCVDGVPVKESKAYKNFLSCNIEVLKESHTELYRKGKQYQQAQERVLFHARKESFTQSNSYHVICGGCVIGYWKGNAKYFIWENENRKTISDLIPFGIHLKTKNV